MWQLKNISLKISTGSYESFIANIVNLAKVRQSSYVCVANVHMLIEAYWDRSFQKIVLGADIVTPDGMPLAKSLKLLYGLKQDRVCGMDLLPDLLKESITNNLSVYFYGGTQKMLDQTGSYIEENYPSVNVAGFYSPPFRPLSAEEEDEIAEKINNSGANIVFVVLGCPKQERWMAGMKNKINAVMIGIGGALPVMIGMQQRAPKWMQDYSLEWLYRLKQEPKRLFKRYFVTNSLFLILLTYVKFRNKKNKIVASFAKAKPNNLLM
jgi:N-acetylglucosaminyldiphosphoundecaprenol N-acetyl-beta-D-mannosaminyltransferase